MPTSNHRAPGGFEYVPPAFVPPSTFCGGFARAAGPGRSHMPRSGFPSFSLFDNKETRELRVKH